MIKAVFNRNRSGTISNFSITGHADSGPYGQDIVCAAVSGLSITMINGLEQVTDGHLDVVMDEQNGGLIEVNQLSDQHDTQLLLETFFNGIRDMAKSYPNNLTLK